jgi:hypothetical protein
MALRQEPAAPAERKSTKPVNRRSVEFVALSLPLDENLDKGEKR